MTQGSNTILYVDDDADDREFLTVAINEANPLVDVVLAENGLQAIKYLKNAKESNLKLPSLIILDINMPYLDGKETFRQIKNDPDLNGLSIIVFTSSANPNDKALFRSLGVELITKPQNINRLNEIANYMLDSYA